MDDKLFETLLSNYKTDTISHAILIETNDIEQCYEETILFIKKIVANDNPNYTKKSIDLDNISEIAIINKENTDIKKEQILELQARFSSIPSEINNNIYIIVKPEKMNLSAGNTILKFLEEPERNIIGIFLTENYISVLPTIVSRCSIYKKNYDNTSFYETLNIEENEYINYLSIVEKVVSLIEDKKVSNLFFYKNDLKDLLIKKQSEIGNEEGSSTDKKENRKTVDRAMFVILLRILSNIYYVSIADQHKKNNVEKALIKLIREKNSIAAITEKIKIIEEIIRNNNYNVNIDLSIDKLFIEMGRIDV